MLKPNHHEKISLLVPFRADVPERWRNWAWLRQYWEHELPDAEVIMGRDDAQPFCKTHAVNDAFEHSVGDILVILDADCYISGQAILESAAKIREARRRLRKVWFIPYKRFYRLTELASVELLASDPDDPMHFGDPPAPDQFENVPASASFGHWFGALIQVMPKEAFIEVGGMDERFTGWGGEDVSMMHALDTLYGKHRLINGPVYHIAHPVIRGDWMATRQWQGQTRPEQNDALSGHYEYANGDQRLMRKLITGESPYED